MPPLLLALGSSRHVWASLLSSRLMLAGLCLPFVLSLGLCLVLLVWGAVFFFTLDLTSYVVGLCTAWGIVWHLWGVLDCLWVGLLSSDRPCSRWGLQACEASHWNLGNQGPISAQTH